VVQPDKRRNVVESLMAHLAGQGRLSSAYWGFGVGGTLLISFSAVLIAFFLLPSALRKHHGALESPEFVTFLAVTYWILAAYHLLVAVLVWRNAYNVMNRLWGHFARLIVAVSLVLLVGALLSS
jgi:hypothetical protein